MKDLRLILLLLLATVCSHAQSTLIVGAPANNGGTTTLRAPNGTSSHTSLRAHLLITAAELASIPMGTSIQGIGFLLSNGCDTPASGNIQFYLENTTDLTNSKSTHWATAITGMTSVYNGTYNLPTSGGPIDHSTTSTFTYTGGGLYVAYEYVGSSFATTSAAYYCNTTLASGVRVNVSTTTTPPDTLSLSSSFRPEIRFQIPNPYTNNIELLGAYASYGSPNKMLHTTQDFFVNVKNISSATLTNIPISVDVTGANPLTTSYTLASLAPGVDSMVIISGISIANAGSQDVMVTLPVDQDPSSDTIIFSQEVTCDEIGEDYGGAVSSGLGFNTGEGILANLLVLDSGTPAYITMVRSRISDSASVGHSIKGVLLDAAGNIIDSSATYTIALADIENTVDLELLGGTVNHAGDSVYYGFRQISNGTGYFPLAVTDVTRMVPVGLHCSFDATGGGYNNYTNFGAFQLEAIVAPVPSGFSLTSSPASPMCLGFPVVLDASAGLSSYEFFVDGTSVQTGTMNTYSFTPTGNFMAFVTTDFNTCPYSDSIDVIVQQTILDSTAANICSDDEYNFNGTILSTAGVYMDTFVSSFGCDSVQILTLGVLSNSADSVLASICDGDSYDFNGMMLSTGGLYIDTLNNQNGCDSVVTLTLTVLPRSVDSIADAFCTGETYDFNGIQLSNPGVYMDTLMKANGCDSIIVLTLDQINIDTSVTQNADYTLTANQNGANYEWYDCTTGNSTGVTTQTLTHTTSAGNYQVEVMYNGCTLRSGCHELLEPESLADLEFGQNVLVYPNPAEGSFTITSKKNPITTFQIMDVLGRLIKSEDVNASIDDIKVDIRGFESGMYMIHIFSGDRSVIKKLEIR